MTTKEAFLLALRGEDGTHTISEFSTTFSLRQALDNVRLTTASAHVLPKDALKETIKEVNKMATSELDKPRMESDEIAVRNDLISHPSHYRPCRV